MKAGIYIRVSTDEQAQKGYSLNEQRETCRSRALELGADEVLEFADEGVSGSLIDRTGLNRLREYISAGRINLLVVRDPDRLSRRLSHQLLLTEEIERAGVSLQFLDFDWQDTPDGRLFYAIRGAIAEYEKEKIRERTSRGRLQKARQGGVPVGFHAYGYMYHRETGRVLVHPEESEVVRQVFNWFVNGDLGLNGVAKRLNESRVPTRRGRLWHRQVIRQIIANPVYTGRWRYKEVEIPVPPLVDSSLWERAQSKLQFARRLWAGKGRQQYLLSGIIVCGLCGSTMNGVYANRWGTRERRYTCYKNSQGARERGCRPQRSLNAESMEQTVWEQVKRWLNDPAMLAEEIKKQLYTSEMWAQELGRAERNIAEAKKGQESIIEALSSGLMELDDNTRTRLASLKQRREKWEKLRREALEGMKRWEENRGIPQDLQAAAGKALKEIDLLRFAEKRALVRALVKQVVVGKASGEEDLNDGRDSPAALTLYIRLPNLS